MNINYKITIEDNNVKDIKSFLQEYFLRKCGNNSEHIKIRLLEFISYKFRDYMMKNNMTIEDIDFTIDFSLVNPGMFDLRCNNWLTSQLFNDCYEIKVDHLKLKIRKLKRLLKK